MKTEKMDKRKIECWEENMGKRQRLKKNAEAKRWLIEDNEAILCFM